jgi:hypothetical protein
MSVIRFKPRHQPIDLDDLAVAILAAASKRTDADQLVAEFLAANPNLTIADLHGGFALAMRALGVFRQLLLDKLGERLGGGDAA